jgi:hypothetical protein
LLQREKASAKDKHGNNRKQSTPLSIEAEIARLQTDPHTSDTVKKALNRAMSISKTSSLLTDPYILIGYIEYAVNAILTYAPQLIPVSAVSIDKTAYTLIIR